MDYIKGRLEQNNIVNEVKSSFLEYSMSVIVSRALPDLRDGLKPVHRRILYSMYESGYMPERAHKKSARIVGDVMGKYHPHGDSSIYEAMVRMAQDFSYRYMLVDGHGNFGNIEGYGAAAMRYTESRLSKISLELLRDINKDTVDFIPNFDESEKEPVVLPSRLPNILVNGTMGIAVGMATNIPPHNLSEIIDGCVEYINNPNIDTLELMQYVKGPDFPTGGVILGNSGIKRAYETGKGSITIRSRASIQEVNGKQCIIIDEVPYGVNTLELKNKVAELVHNKTIEGIADYHTDLKNGIKITITLKKDANAQVVLNKLYKHTSFQSNFSITFLMLDNGVPRTLGLKDIISKYIDYQKEIIIRRTKYELDKAEKRVHILHGYKIALDNIDEVISIIKKAGSDLDAKEKLILRFGFTDIQADAILELKLRRLTSLEKTKIENELENLLLLISELKDILSSNERVEEIIKKELIEIKDKYGDERKTSIDMSAVEYIEDESLIPNDSVIITLTNKGYVKRILSNTYKSQNRGGVGIKGITTNEEDFPEKVISMNTHDYILMFTNYGKVYRMKGYEIPEFSRQSKGLPIVNLIPIEKEEKVTSVVIIQNENECKKYLMFFTKLGLTKRTDISEFVNIRNNGKKAIVLKENDELITVKKTSGNDEILIGASNGRIARFCESEVRVMGRASSGVKGMEFTNEKVIGAEVVNIGDQVLIISENGYGKKTFVEKFRLTHRGSKGVKALNLTEKNGKLVSLKTIAEDEDLVIITDNGITIRIPTDQVSILNRNTQGIKLINLKEEQKVSTIALIPKEDLES